MGSCMFFLQVWGFDATLNEANKKDQAMNEYGSTMGTRMQQTNPQIGHIYKIYKILQVYIGSTCFFIAEDAHFEPFPALPGLRAAKT